MKSEQDKKSYFARTMLVTIVLYLFLLLSVIHTDFTKSGETDLVQFVHDNPVIVVGLIFMVVLFVLFFLRALTIRGAIRWLQMHLLKYVARFGAFLITGYITYFVIFTGEANGIYEVFIVALLYLCAFLVFLLAAWFDEIEPKPVDRSVVPKLRSRLLRPMLVYYLPGIILGIIYYFVFHDWGEAFTAGIVNGVWTVMAFTPKLIRRWVKVLAGSALIVLHMVLLYMLVGAGGITPNTAIIAIVVGTVSMVIAQLIDWLGSEKNWIKKTVYSASEDEGDGKR